MARNPHRYAGNTFLAEDSDFTRATQRVYRSRKHPAGLEVGVGPAEEG